MSRDVPDDFWVIRDAQGNGYDLDAATAADVMRRLTGGIEEFVTFTDLHGNTAMMRASAITDVYETTTTGRASLRALKAQLDAETRFAT